MHPINPVLDLRPVEAPQGASPGATVYVMLPRLDALVGRPGFGLSAPICVPGSDAFDAPRFFGAAAVRLNLH